MARKIAKTIEEIAQYQFEDSLTISSLMNKLEDDSRSHNLIQKELEDLKDNVREILGLLRNDDTTNSKGIVEQTRTNDARIDKLEKFNGELAAKMGVLGLVTAGIFNFVLWLIGNIKFNK